MHTPQNISLHASSRSLFIHISFYAGHNQDCMTPVIDVLVDVSWNNYKRKARLLLFIHKECIFRCRLTVPGETVLLYVAGDLRPWSRCLGSDKITAEGTGVTTFRQEGHRHTHAKTQIVCHIECLQLFVPWQKDGNLSEQRGMKADAALNGKTIKNVHSS